MHGPEEQTSSRVWFNFPAKDNRQHPCAMHVTHFMYRRPNYCQLLDSLRSTFGTSPKEECSAVNSNQPKCVLSERKDREIQRLVKAGRKRSNWIQRSHWANLLDRMKWIHSNLTPLDLIFQGLEDRRIKCTIFITHFSSVITTTRFFVSVYPKTPNQSIRSYSTYHPPLFHDEVQHPNLP